MSKYSVPQSEEDRKGEHDMTEEYMREVEKIKKALKERINPDISDSQDRLRFFNHFLRFCGDAKTPRELLAMAVERDESQHSESVAAMYKRVDAAHDEVFCYCCGQNRELMKDNPAIVILALGSFLDNCRSQAETDYYTSMTPDELLVIFKEEQIEVYGEEAVLSDPRWNGDFWQRSN